MHALCRVFQTSTCSLLQGVIDLDAEIPDLLRSWYAEQDWSLRLLSVDNQGPLCGAGMLRTTRIIRRCRSIGHEAGILGWSCCGGPDPANRYRGRLPVALDNHDRWRGLLAHSKLTVPVSLRPSPIRMYRRATSSTRIRRHVSRRDVSML